MMQVQLIQFAKFTFSLLMIAGVASSDPPDSPCPDLFQYKFDGSDWIGLIELNKIKVDQIVINVIVELSLPTSLPSPYKGRLDLLEEKQQASQAVFDSKPLFYRINFPLKNPIPRVTLIAVDNNVLCSGPPGQSPQMTIFKLHHVFYPKKSNITERTSNDGSPCELADGTAGVCTIINKCAEIYKRLIRYEELAKIRCGFVDGTDVVCCKDPDPPTGRRAKDACAKHTPLGQFRYMAMLGYISDLPSQKGEEMWKCPGALISDQFLLASGHCLSEYRNRITLARLGQVKIVPNKSTEASYDYLIDEKIQHPNYKHSYRYHDIALVKLKTKVDFTKNIRPVCLNTNQARLPPKTSVIFQQYYNTRELYLLTNSIESAEFSSCNQSHANIQSLPNGLAEDHMCAFGIYRNEGCEQQPDGFLQIFDDSGKITLYGWTTFKAGCNFPLPIVFTRVSNYIEWIESIVWPYMST